jgi:hypothetical protein
VRNLTKQLYISFDGLPLKVTSESLAKSFLHAFDKELEIPLPKLESFRSVEVSKFVTWLEFHYLNDLYLTEDEVYYLRYVHFNLYNLYQSAAIEEVYFRVLQNDFTGLVTIRK